MRNLPITISGKTWTAQYDPATHTANLPCNFPADSNLRAEAIQLLQDKIGIPPLLAFGLPPVLHLNGTAQTTPAPTPVLHSAPLLTLAEQVARIKKSVSVKLQEKS